MRKGSVTVFMSMTIMLIASLCFTLLEVSRYYGLKSVSNMASEVSADSVCSDYLTPMYQQYGILGVDYSRATANASTSLFTDRLLELSDKTIATDVNYYDVFCRGVELEDYLVMTDCNGAPFIKAAVASYKSSLSDKALSEIGQGQDLVNNQEDNQLDVDSQLEAGSTALSSSSDVSTGVSNTNVETVDNPVNVIEQIKKLKAEGVLSMVVGDEAKLSDACLVSSDLVSKRSLASGSFKKGVAVSTLDKAIFSKYLQSNFSSYRNNFRDKSLRYELEYVVAGKTSDKENIEAVVNKILAIRETANAIAILKSPTKMEEVTSLAVSLAGASANVAVIEVVKYSIVAAWAYMESILDVRLLLNDGKVAPIKTDTEWTSNLLTMSSYFPVTCMAKECANGQSYEDYLLAMTSLMSTKKLSYRAMDIVENYVRSQNYYENTKMDHVICRFKAKYTYQASPMFYSLITVKAGFLDCYEFSNDKSRSFIN